MKVEGIWKVFVEGRMEKGQLEKHNDLSESMLNTDVFF